MINSTSIRAHTNILRPAVTTTTSVGNPTATGSASTTISNTIGSAPRMGEKVTISAEGQAALEKSKSPYQEIANSSDPNIAIRIYQVPDWMRGTGIELTPELGGNGVVQSGNSGKIYNADQNTRNEYTKLISEHYESVLSKNEIKTQEEHYNALIADKSNSEKLHLQFRESVSSDKKLTEIMQKIGIQLP